MAAAVVLMTKIGPGYCDNSEKQYPVQSRTRGSGKVPQRCSQWILGRLAGVSKCRWGGGHQAWGTAISCLSTSLAKSLTPHNEYDAVFFWC